MSMKFKFWLTDAARAWLHLLTRFAVVYSCEVIKGLSLANEVQLRLAHTRAAAAAVPVVMVVCVHVCMCVSVRRVH